MTRIPRLLPCLTLACSMTLSGMVTQTLRAIEDPPAPAPAPADAPAADEKPATTKPARPKPAAAAPAADAPAPADAPTTAPAAAPEIPQNQSLNDDVDDFWHYGKIARYDMAAAFGNKILTRAESPLEILGAFETTASGHHDGLDDWILRWEGIDAAGMKGVAAKIQDLLGKGRHERRSLPKYITENIEGLTVNERAYAIHLKRLAESGELAVPQMVDALASKDPAKAYLKDPIRRALVDLGRGVLNPLLAATETKDEELKLSLIEILSRIGYDVSVPYLARITADHSHPGLASAATEALGRMGTKAGNVSDQFYKLSEKFYYNNSSIQADMKAPAAYMWFYGDGGLTYKEVPPAIFSDLMAEREAEYALQLGPGTRDALSLWLAANNKMEVDLPEGAANGMFEKDRPAANYYNVYAGAQYLNAALTRSLDDHSSQVALKLIKSLGEIVGPSSQGSGVAIDPLVQSMRYPDRLVRYEAAFALAAGLPNSPFTGHERVAPMLAEAVSQTGTANVLIVVSSQADEQKYSGELKQYGIASGTSATQAFANAIKLPSVDVILFPDTLSNAEIDQIYQLAASNPRLQRSAKVIVTTSKLSPWAARGIADPLTIVTQAPDAVSLAAVIEDARNRSGGKALDEKIATEYSVRAAQTIQRLAEGRVSAFDLTVTQPTLLASLNDKRPEVVKAVGEALAYMNGDQFQVSLLTLAVAEKTPDDVRTSILKSLAKNAKFFGNHLAQPNIDDLQKQVDNATNPDVRNAAAEARGALNLPADQAKELIVKQVKR